MGVPVPGSKVALRKESVDRNMDTEKIRKLKSLSLSVRRAWIEIWLFGLLRSFTRSLSVRRAWIEIYWL